MNAQQITKSEKFNGTDTFILPINLLFPGEDISKNITPENIDNYPIVVYADGEIQDGHHRFAYMKENNYKEVRVILAHDIDEDWAVDESDWIDGLFEQYWK